MKIYNSPLLNIIDKPSPYFNQRPKYSNIDMIILHHTELNSDAEAIEVMLERKVSCHYLISKKGRIFRIVPEKYRAWHAGVSYWQGRENINNYSIGIELDNNGLEEFSASLMESLIALCKNIMSRYRITAKHVLGHSDIAPDRKNDPSKFFNWKKLAENNLIKFPADNIENDVTLINIELGSNNKLIFDLQLKLRQLGYNIPITGEVESFTLNIIKIFKQKFNANSPTILWTNKDNLILNSLV